MSNPAKREKKIQFLEALEEKKRRRRAAPLAYFEPHDKQRRFFDAQAEKRIVIFAGGNRSGKTVGHVVAALDHAYGYRIADAFRAGDARLTPQGDYPPREEVPPRYWIRRSDGVPLRPQRTVLSVTGLSLLKGVGRILWPELQNWLPEALHARLRVSRGAFGVPMRITHPDGHWSIDFGSVEQGSMAFEGAKYDAVGFDEPPHRTVFTAVWRGCIDFVAPVWLTFTPLGTHAPWLYDEFFVGERNDTAIINVAQTDNPHLTREALKAFEAGVQFTEEEELARKSGRFGFLTHRAFQILHPDVHFIRPFQIPPSWPRLCACDPASRRPFYFVWLTHDRRRNTTIAYREFPIDKLHHHYRNSEWAINDYATIIRNLEGTERITGRCIDPRFGPAEYTIKGQKTTSVCDDFSKYGLHFDARVPDTGREETGIERIRQLLWYDTRLPVTELNKPKLLITDDCPSLQHALENYSFVPPDARDDRVLKEKTIEAFKDPIDALRYGILYGIPAPMDRHSHEYIRHEDWMNENTIDDSWL